MRLKDTYNTLRFITNHPLTKDHKFSTLKRFLKWQINTLLNPYPIVYPWIGNTKLIIKKGMTGATGNLYAGLHEFQGMSLLLHFLSENDLFVDIGANIGSYTILAAGCNRANVIAVEPVPNTFSNLQDNAIINKLLDKVKLLNIGVGATTKKVKFTSDFDTMNHVYVEGETTNNIEVQIDKLDNILKDSNPVMVKIDVEGYEGEVLKGAETTLNYKNLRVIIIEINNTALKYGYKPDEIHKTLVERDFNSFYYDPLNRRFLNKKIFSEDNVIYVRDMDFVMERLIKTEKIKVMDKSY